MTDRIIEFVRKKDLVLEEEIGQGACGKTVLLYDPVIDERFVCKKYSPVHEPFKEQLFSNFVQEIKLLHLLYHPNIVRVFNYYIYPDQFAGFILMERIVGDDIDEYLNENPQDAGSTFRQIVEGFAHLETSEILHRDIRPQNVLVSKDGVPKIIDFGFGKRIAASPDFNKSISLNWWCEPPDDFSDNTYDYSTEVYFVGKLFEKSIVDANIEQFPYRSLLLRMCQKDPARRPPSFLKIRQEILTGQFDLNPFSDSEMEAYRDFAEAITMACSKIEQSARYFTDADKLARILEDAHQKVMLEEFVPSNTVVLQCLINGEYYFRKQNCVAVACLQAFLQLFRSCPREKRQIILSNLHTRLDAIERYSRPSDDFDDDIPF